MNKEKSDKEIYQKNPLRHILLDISKLQDAYEAGTQNSSKCTLILTEGDSAKALAMSGLTVLGRDYYGIYPLKGKLLNVRDAHIKTVMANEQIQNLLAILGLQIGKDYGDLKSLRYGSIMIMANQDTEGSHFKGLIINFINCFWPSLFKMKGFISLFITPLIKAFKDWERKIFYTMNDFKMWCKMVQNIQSWRIKYYKGLGTSSDEEAKYYFRTLTHHRIEFYYVDKEDDDAIQLIFSKKKVENRKLWLSASDPNANMLYDLFQIRYKEFVDHEYIHFSNEDNHRSMASFIDGFKPGQRKILFGCFKRKLGKELKVAQLAGYIAQNSVYHHGEMSLVDTIVGMAQNFVGSNNINLLMPNGQFGSRNLGGKDHAPVQYIFTTLNILTRLLFPQPDDHTLTYVQHDGQIVQPQFYMPIIPMILVNGCQGIGTGWSTFIPNFNPREICEIIKRKLRSLENFPEIHPWYRNFTGKIIPNENRTSYEVTGNLYIDQKKDHTVIINELPVSKWTKDYKNIFEDIMNKGKDKIVALREYHTKDRVHFQIEMNEQFFNSLYSGDGKLFKLEKYFKLSTSLSLNNMVGYNLEKQIVKMPNVRAIFQYFFWNRLQFYQKRKEYLKSRIRRQLEEMKQKERFILEVVEEKINIRNVKKADIYETLFERQYKKFTQLPKIKTTKVDRKPKKEQQEGIQQSQSSSQDEIKINNNEYNYLLKMPLQSLSYENVQKMQIKQKVILNQYEMISKIPIQQMWIQDIDKFIQVLSKVQFNQKIQRDNQELQINERIKKAKVQTPESRIFQMDNFILH